MNVLKLLVGATLVGLVAWGVLTVATLGGVGVEAQLLGSEWQLAGLVTGAAILAALAGYAALGGFWRDMATPYW